MKPKTRKPKKKPMSLAQRLVFHSPFGKAAESRAAKIIPSYARMGVKVYD